MEFNGEVYDLDKPIDERISKGSFGRNGFRIIKSLNYQHLDKQGAKMKEKLLELAAEKKFEELIELVILEKKKIKTEEKEKMIKLIKELASFKEEIKKSKSTNQELEKFTQIYKKNKQN